MPTERKNAIVEELTKKLSDCTIAISTDFRGLPVVEMTNLRRELREKGVEYRVVKNTLTYLAADAAGKPAVKEIVKETTGLALGYDDDPVITAKTLVDYIRTARSSLTIRGASFDGQILTAEEVTRLAQLPPKELLLAQLMGQMKAPIYGLVNVLSSPMRGLVTVLQRHAEQNQSNSDQDQGDDTATG